MGFHHFLHIYTSCVWSCDNLLFIVYHSGYYSLVSLVFGTIYHPYILQHFNEMFYTLCVVMYTAYFSQVLHIIKCNQLEIENQNEEYPYICGFQ